MPPEKLPEKLDLLQGTLDLMVLQTLATMGPLHGYGIARRIEEVSGDEVLLNQGTIYASLVRLQQRGWISAEWGTSDNNRKAKYYAITKVSAIFQEMLTFQASRPRESPTICRSNETAAGADRESKERNIVQAR
jgi:transcriptional regulator